MSPQKQPEKRIYDLIRDEAWDEVRALLADYHSADIADIINKSPSSVHEKLFSLVEDDDQPDVLSELESVAESDVLESLTPLQISDIVEEMAPDDAADILADLPEERSEEILHLMEKEESDDVRELLQYEEDTAGGIMTTDVVEMHETQTVEEAIHAIAYLDTDEQFLYAYIIDKEEKLLGYVHIWELLRERTKNKKLEDMVHRKYIAATVNTDQEEVALLMSKYDLSSLPVTDSTNKLVGRITADDVLDVMEEEASEDIFRMAGSDDAELEETSPIKSCFVRLPWLFITLAGGFVTAYILSKFQACSKEVMVLIGFVPSMLAMGGNTGIQSSTLMVRSIALGDLKGRNVYSILLKEILTGALMGSICGLIIWVGALFFISYSPETHNPILEPAYLAMVIAFALFSAMTFAAVFGAFVPIALNKMKIDPAVASGPFISITNDISALLIYFAVTLLLVHNLVAF